MNNCSFVSFSDARKCLKKRLPDFHKGEAGTVLVVGGSKDYIGSPALAGLSALRSGVDLVKVAAPENAAYCINCLSLDLVTAKFDGDYFNKSHVKEITSLSKEFDSVLLGNGISLNKGTREFMRKLIPKIKNNLILDADAIKAAKGLKLKGVLLTPHMVEFKEVFGEIPPLKLSERIKLVKEKAGKSNSVILLKGRIDVIAEKEKTKLNSTGNARMAVAGTGDALAGLAAGFAAQCGDLFDAACAAAFVNGKAGELLAREKGNSFIASDLIEVYPRILKKK
ncbi:MAG: NAD(P)H-hydrate dehydratase [archaeon]